MPEKGRERKILLDKQGLFSNALNINFNLPGSPSHGTCKLSWNLNFSNVQPFLAITSKHASLSEFWMLSGANSLSSCPNTSIAHSLPKIGSEAPLLSVKV